MRLDTLCGRYILGIAVLRSTLFPAGYVSPYPHVAGAAVDVDSSSGAYTEDLTIQRLGNGHAAARFVFRSEWTPQQRHRCQAHEDSPAEGEAVASERPAQGRDGKLCHFEAVFPRAVGVLLDRFKVR